MSWKQVNPAEPLRDASTFGYDRMMIRGGDDVTRNKMIEAIRMASVNNRLTCEKAHELARELNTSLSEVGALCDELKIKIAACRLGCF